MNLKQLQEQGGFVPAKPVKTSVTWKKRAGDLGGEGEEVTFDIFVRKLSYGLLEEAALTNDKTAQRSMLISHAVRLGAKGDEQLTYEQAYQLEPSLAHQFYIAVAKANALPKPKEEGDAEGVEDPKG